MTKELSVAEFGALQQCERDMEGGHAQMAQALLRIRDGRLYREHHANFKDYCADRWGFKKSQAWRLVSYAETLNLIESSPPIGGKLITPQNEAQIRPLTRLPLEDRAEAWAQAVVSLPSDGLTAEGITLSAELVEGVVEKIKPKDAVRPSRPPPTQDEIDVRAANKSLEDIFDIPYSGNAFIDRYGIEALTEKTKLGLGWCREMHSAVLGKEPISIPLIDGSFWHPPTDFIDEMAKALPTVDIEERLRFIQGWNHANPTKRKTRRGIKKHVFYMLSHKQDDRFNGEDNTDPNAGRHQAL
ncbi:hypothetical protein LCGC14_2857090 [marine sediment metagenome]|uniref:Bacteriophage lambda Replication protein O N-terminal domain-containing protein n=1 Tax=marine sediment metagenome TaxID=412755 RepID=A0A0F9AXN8_9ZZZZ